MGEILQQNLFKQSTGDYHIDIGDGDNDNDDEEACNIHVDDVDDKHCPTVVAAEANHAILAPHRRSSPRSLTQ